MIPDRIAVARSRGFTLIELIVFIAVVAIVGTTLIHAFGSTMRGSHFGKEMTQATQLAQQRLEVILGQRRLGFNGFNPTTFDPCDTVGPQWAAQACQTTNYGAGQFSVSSTLADTLDACGVGTGTNCKLITVTVGSPYGGQLSNVMFQVWNY